MSAIQANFPATTTHYLTSSPAKLASKNQYIAHLYGTISKVCLVAGLAIATATLTIAITGTLLTGASPFLLLGAILGSPLFMLASQSCSSKAQSAQERAVLENQTVSYLNILSDYSSKEIREIFSGIANCLPTDDTSLKERLPLLARYMRSYDSAQISLNQAFRHILKEYPDSYIAQIDQSEGQDRKIKDQLRFNTRETGYRILEGEALPALLQSALMLELIRNPFQNLELRDLGSLHPKPIAHRITEIFHDQKEDYFHWNDLRRPPLSVSQITQSFQSDPTALGIWALLFSSDSNPELTQTQQQLSKSETALA